MEIELSGAPTGENDDFIEHPRGNFVKSEEDGDGSSCLRKHELSRPNSRSADDERPNFPGSAPPRRGTRGKDFRWYLEGIGEE